MRTRNRRPSLAIFMASPALAAAVLASACGGGGGGSSSAPPQAVGPATPPPPPPPPQQTCVQTADFGCISRQLYEDARQTLEDDYNAEADYRNQWGLTAIRASRAYAQLELEHGAGTEPGSGQTVGLIDTGIDTGHPVFAGKAVTEQFYTGTSDETGNTQSHGTAVASVIVGRPSAAFTANVTAARGVARGADVAMFAYQPDSRSQGYSPVQPAVFGALDDTWEDLFGDVIDWSSGGRSIDFVNLSWGFDGIIEHYSAADLRTNLSGTIGVLVQAGAGEKTVFVWAAGNAHGKPCTGTTFVNDPDLCENLKIDARSVEVLPGLPARIPELLGHMVAVVAVGRDGAIAPFSNRCGIAAEWCIAAPGVEIRVAYFGPDPDDGSPGFQSAADFGGTSFAAPMVTGSLAVMKHYFRGGLSNTKLVERLLETANDTGIYDDPEIYGQGLLDLGAATTPVGVTSVVLGERVDGPGTGLAQTRFALGGALGDGLARALAGHEIAAFDSLGAPFWYPLGALAGAAPRSLHRRAAAVPHGAAGGSGAGCAAAPNRRARRRRWVEPRHHADARP